MTSTLRLCTCVAVAGLIGSFPLTFDSAVAADSAMRDESDKARLAVVEAYADRVLEMGRDRWSGEQTPLFADGVNVDTGDPVVWVYSGDQYVISNMATQQNLFRVLAGLSNLTGEARYRAAAEASIAYHFEHLADRSGLLRWGGHQFIDLATLEPVGEFDANCHEFKNNFPFYELMWEVDSAATTRFMRALWHAHVTDWRVLDMNRHGRYGQHLPDDLWDQAYDEPAPFFESDGLSFINAGGDLIYAAGHLRALADEEEAWTWGQRLAHLYVKARHPDTHLGAYQYSKPRRREEPPAEGPLEGRETWSSYGDRAENQFGEQFGDVAREGWALWGTRVARLYATSGFMKLGLAESMGEAETELREWTADGLEALAEHAYMPDANAFRPMWADGTDLTGKQFARTGYYGQAGTEWKPLQVDMRFLMTYVRAYRLTQRAALWDTARAMAKGLGIGDIGHRPGQAIDLDMEASGDSPEEIFTLLELHRAAPSEAYLQRARLVADRMIEQRYHHGFFLPSKAHVNAKFDAIEPLALLSLDAVLRGEPEQVPQHVGGRGYIHGSFDGHGRTYDHRVIWNATRDHDRPQYRAPAPWEGEHEGGLRGQYHTESSEAGQLVHFERGYAKLEDIPDFEDDDAFTVLVRARMHDDKRFLCAYRYHLQRSQFRTRGDDPLTVTTGIDNADPRSLAIVYDGSAERRTLKAYVDGELVDQDATTGSPLSTYDATSVRVGMTPHSGGLFAEVSVWSDSLRIMERAMQADEIRRLHGSD